MTEKANTVAIAVEDIVPDPSQPRKTFSAEALRNLSDSFLKTGQISPIVVRPGPDKKYTIVVGERRWRAAKEAGLSHVECIIRQDIDDQRAIEMQIAENCQREDIPPLEQASSLKAYLDTYGISQSELSRRTGLPQRSISNRLALLSLPASLQARIEADVIGPYEALKIAALPPEQQEAVAEAVASGQIGGRGIEEMARQYPRSGNKRAKQQGQPAKAVETPFEFSRRLENLERAVYEIVATYAVDKVAKQMDESSGKTPPCPECLKQGERGSIQGVKRRMTAKDREELENIVSAEDLGPPPTHIIEAKCSKCDYMELITYVWE